jgi:hypothetical protein
MNHWMWPVSLVGILSTAVLCGKDMFFLTIGRPALRLASPSAGTEIMGFLHILLPNFLLVVLSRSGQRWFYLASLLSQTCRFFQLKVRTLVLALHERFKLIEADVRKNQP